jgi:hypothetical protein
MTLEFKDELLIPRINGEVYFKIYELENWLRRISLTAYMKEFGADWKNRIPVQLRNGIESRAKQNEDMFYLDLSGDDNLIWTATQWELKALLLDDAIAHQIKDLTGFSKSTLSQKLEELKGIRNILAHNKALTNTAITIVTGVIASLMQGVKYFKIRVLYADLKSGDEVTNNAVFSYFENAMEENDWGKFQAVAFMKGDIYELACWPGPNQAYEGTYLSASKLLEIYKNVLANILAIAINKRGYEYTVLFTPKIEDQAIRKIINLFTKKHDIWTQTSFEQQNPKFICNPKIWFYENRRPLEE